MCVGLQWLVCAIPFVDILPIVQSIDHAYSTLRVQNFTVLLTVSIDLKNILFFPNAK